MSSVEKDSLREWRSQLVEQVGDRVLEIGWEPEPISSSPRKKQ